MPLDQVLDLLRCPRCRASFTADGRTLRCGSGHTFDIARQGYANLLGRAAPRSADTAAMVAARERFLDRGGYEAIADSVAAVSGVGHGPDGTVLEVGAGSGYYLSRVLAGTDGRGVALDVSPAAARRAAGAHPRIGALVADAWQELPLVDAGFAVLLSVFAPRNPAEFARVLRPDGRLVVASPLPDHLVELREPLGLLGIQDAKQDRIAAALAAAFRAGERRDCRYRIELDHAAVADLVQMGPNAFHADDDLAAGIAGLADPVSVTVAVAVSAWRPG